MSGWAVVTLRRYSELKPSAGTRWPDAVRAHVASHQPPCLGPIVGMPEPCMGQSELDHVRAGGTGLKSASIAVNAARTCSAHHRRKTEEGRTWRPLLLDAIAALHGDCEACRAEQMDEYGVPFPNVHASHVDPCGPLCRAARR